jgi:hypothetical protein
MTTMASTMTGAQTALTAFEECPRLGAVAHGPRVWWRHLSRLAAF